MKVPSAHELKLIPTPASVPVATSMDYICMYMCIYVCTCVYIHVYACMYVCTFMCQMLCCDDYKPKLKPLNST